VSSARTSARSSADGAKGSNVRIFPQLFDGMLARKPAGGSFSIETADGGPQAGDYSSLALDGSGGVHVSYQDAGKLKYALKPCL
jgi:hypothetical protein